MLPLTPAKRFVSKKHCVDSIRWLSLQRTTFAKTIPPGPLLFSHVYLPERTPDGQPQRKPSEHPDFMKYDFMADPEFEKPPPPVELLLLEDIKDLGEKFDIVKVSAEVARWDLLLKRRAVYASPFNLKYYAEKRKKYLAEMESRVRIPLDLLKMSALLMSQILPVTVSADVEWTLSSEMLINSTQSLGLYITEPGIIHLDNVTTLNGPDPNIEGRLFRFYITLNGQMIVPMIGRITHISVYDSTKSLFPTDDKQMDRIDNELLAKFGLITESVFYSCRGLDDILAAEGGIGAFMAKRREKSEERGEEK
ncbi:hypothetical protein niasHT_005351 [Heterodera trifolii]|uniref:Large ribosomal subunit protein bL9m n=1 Tax=Heterodera trifolii TaxID=157864 RepID=A0ABD2M111_9BILA